MQKGFAPILLVIIFAAILTSAGVYWSSFKKASEVVIQEKMVSPTPPNETNYENAQLGFKLVLPGGFLVKEESEKDYFKRSNGDVRKNFTYYIQYLPPDFINSFYVLENGEDNLDKAKLAIVVFKNPDNLDAQKFYNKYWYYPFVWGDFTAGKNKIAPENIEQIGGKEGKYGIVDYREGKPKFIYLPLESKDLMFQIQLPSQGNEAGQKILESLKFE